MRIARKLLIALLIVLLVALIGGGIAWAVLNGSNAARPEAVAALEPDTSVTVSRLAGEDWYVFTPTAATPTTGLILYPGGFVDPVAYADVARDIAAAGYLVVIDPMPLNLAVTGIESADAIIAAFPDITAWAIGGHSLGGAMAAEYVKNNPGAIAGLALWAAYPAANTDLSGLPLEVVSIYGDADGVASIDDVLGGAARLPAGAQFVLIPGANHTQFGRYGQGLQRGDNPATIDRDAQQAAVVAATLDLLAAIDSQS
ncbi:MAG TPA: alpha/beta hydrolase [Promineifilum sp.]|nr:alpha/beta hydrolase [Promineifilum sp.]